MEKPSRNDPCPCGSNKRYKQCCGQLDKAPVVHPAPATPDISKAIETALEHHKAGRLPQAKSIYQQVLQAEPNHHQALHLLGLTANQEGEYYKAIELINRAIQAAPSKPGYHYNLGCVYNTLNKPDEAIACYQKALAIKPDYADALNNLGSTLKNRGKPDEAIACYRQVLAIKPDHADALNNLGSALNDLCKPDEAIPCYQKALAIRPDHAGAHNNLGSALKSQGKLDEAIACYRKALAIKPDYADALNNLGIALKDQGRPDEAIACYQKALAIKPDDVLALNNLGIALKSQGKLDEAIACYQKILAAQPDDAAANNNLGNALKELGKAGEAIAYFQKALAIKPGFAEAHNNKLLTAHYATLYSPAALFTEHLKFAEQFEAPLKQAWRRHLNARDPKKPLKVGYISADFRNHPVAYFIDPVLASHDKSQVEVFCYYNHNRHDSYTDRIKAAADHWVPCQGMPDDLLAERIRADGIDILVDLAGHTAENRLLVFARKPAPVQVTYLGYLNTTGLSAMDYRLTHIDTDPPANDAYYSETLYRLPGNLWWCYRPRPGTPEVAPPPAIANGFVTFGSTNNFAKLSPETLAVWADILRALPESRLIIAGVPEGAARTSISARFAAHGIDNHRLIVYGRLSSMQFWELHHQIDIALDPFPYNGGTTTCDALWLGVPVVALTGNEFVSRMGHALLKNIGLPELATESRQEYVNIAVKLANDLGYLKTLRAGMRARLAASPLRDEIGFTRNLETAYRDMWIKWCDEYDQ